MGLSKRYRTNDTAGCLFGPFSKFGRQIGKIGLTLLDTQVELASQASVAKPEQAVHNPVELALALEKTSFCLGRELTLGQEMQLQWLAHSGLKGLGGQQTGGGIGLESSGVTNLLLLTEGLLRLSVLLWGERDGGRLLCQQNSPYIGLD